MKSRNERRLEILIDGLAYTLESLEEYIRHAGYYSDWHSKEQFYRRMFSDSNKWDLDCDEEQIFSNLSAFGPTFKEEPESIRKEAQKEFYKWIDYSGITAENCPEKLKHYLKVINEMLEGRGDKFRQAYKENYIKPHKVKERKENKSVFWEADRETRKFFFGEPIPSDWTKKHYDVKIKGNAEKGQKIFQEIKNSITSQPKWTFPWKKKYYQKLQEKIRELKEKEQKSPKEKPEPKDDWRRNTIISEFEELLRVVELYIKKFNYYPNWKISEWNEEYEDWRKIWENKSIEEINGLLLVSLKEVSLLLRGFKKDDPDYYPHLISELEIELSHWQGEKKIDPKNCPAELKQILTEINQVLEGSWKWRKNKENKENDDEDEQEKIVEIIVKIKLEIAEFTKKYKIKITELDSKFENWEKRLMEMKNVSAAKDYQHQIEKKLQEEKNKRDKHNSPVVANENKLPLYAKIVIGAGIVVFVLGIVIVIYLIVKSNKKEK